MSDIQQGKEDISLTTARSWILPTTWMILEKDSATEIAYKSPAGPTPWFRSCETLNREPAWSPLPILPDFWPMELWNNTWVLLRAAVLHNNRRLTHMFSSIPGLVPLDTLSTPPQCDNQIYLYTLLNIMEVRVWNYCGWEPLAYTYNLSLYS